MSILNCQAASHASMAVLADSVQAAKSAESARPEGVEPPTFGFEVLARIILPNREIGLQPAVTGLLDNLNAAEFVMQKRVKRLLVVLLAATFVNARNKFVAFISLS